MLRISVAVLLFLISLLTLFPAPAYVLWLLAVIVSEFPWLPIIVTALVLIVSTLLPGKQLIADVILALTMLIFLVPVILANQANAYLAAEMSVVFPKKTPRDPREKPFRVGKLFNSGQVTAPLEKVYQQNAGKPLKLAFYPSVVSGIRPCVVVIHGGSWRSGDRAQLPELNGILSKQGYHVAAVDYRLAPAHRYPAPVGDVAKAIEYLKKDAAKLRVDTTRFVLLGRSAGAQIALIAAYTLHDPAIKGVIDLYGPADMVWGYSGPTNPLVMDSRKVMEDYLGGPYRQFASAYKASSPVLHVHKKSPPTLLIHGKNDALVAYEHSTRLDRKLSQNKVPHYLLTLPWATHGFDYNINGPGGQLSTFAVLTFLDSVTN